jgi:2-methylcitrate dehydratase PrpD
MVRAVSALGQLAEFVVKTRLEDCPPAALAQVRRAALDTLGVMLAGAPEPPARLVREVARAEGGLPLCTVVGTRLRTSATWAALANGTAGHAHDFDDTSFVLMGHPSVVLLAATLAVGEAAMADGRTLVLGYVVGFEVGAALGQAVNPAHYHRGWHATATLGTLGAAAAAARAMGLDVEATTHALAIAASLASGLKANFGSMTKPLHAGHAARNGVLAVLLAREGFTGSPHALDGPQGFLAAFAPEAALDEALAALGRRYHLVETGVAIKPYPSCALTHPAVEALLELRQTHALRPEQVAAVEVGVSPLAPGVLLYPRPVTALQRKFSMEYCAAVALARGAVGFEAFEEGEVRDPQVRRLMERVRMVVDPSLPSAGTEQAWSRVTVRLTDGRVLALPPRGATGHPERPLSWEALRAKFLSCASTVLRRGEAEGLAEQIAHLEEIPDLRALTARLAADVE